MPRTGYNTEELRSRVDEVEDLRDEQQKQGFGEMPQDSDDGEDHPCEIAVCISHEDARGVPVMPPEGETDAYKRKEHVQREQMGVCCRMRVRCQQVKRIVENEQESDDERLGHFNSVNACKDVDTVWTEDGHGGHVDVVEDSKLEELAEIGLERGRDHNLGDAEIYEVDD